MDISGLTYQYFIEVKPGVTVTYGQRDYRIQDDGRGWLHIVVQEKGKRKKISIEELQKEKFEPMTMGDYVFNEWWRLYDFETYKQYCLTELKWNEKDKTIPS